MNANKQAKVNVVKEITDKFNASKSVVVAKYAGLTVSEFQDLRKQMAAKDVEIKVYKNRLVKIAAKEAGFEELNNSLTGANVFAFGMSDDISPAKVLAEFAKNHKVVELVAGTFEGKVIDAQGVNEVATLPTLEEALSMLAMQLISPVKFVGVGLHQLTEGDFLSKGASTTEEVKEETPATEEAKVEETKEEAPAEEAKAETNNTEEVTAEAATQEGE